MKNILGNNANLVRNFLIATIIVIAMVWAATPRPEAQTAGDIISADQAYQMAEAGELVIIDIRTPQEWEETGVAAPAVQLSMPADVTDSRFLTKFNAIKADNPDKKIAIICATGGRTGWMHAQLEKNGMGGTLNISEGMFGNELGEGWIKRGLPVRSAEF